jgi:uroporphyrinogen decarboxylase
MEGKLVARGTGKALLRVLGGEALTPPPIWLMRQAGRYLPEYRQVREKAGSFLDLCYTPELAAEVTLQPVRRFGFDAAILFADILLVPQALGLKLRFSEGEGPRLRWPGGAVEPATLDGTDAIDEKLAPIFETVRILRGELPAGTALIGFAGAPWTVATYMVAGRGTPDQAPARRLMFSDAPRIEALVDRVTEATIRYLFRQIEAGAEAVMLFDSWAGVLTPPMFVHHAVRPVRRIVDALAKAHPAVPVIGFPRGAGALYAGFAKATGVTAVGMDAQVPLGWAREALAGTPLQGNLDPMLMVVGGQAMENEARRIVQEMRGHPHVFNLGHGITPDADPRNVEALIEVVRR